MACRTRHFSCPALLFDRSATARSAPGRRSPGVGFLRRSVAALACAVSILGAANPVRAQTDQVRVSIAAPALAAGTGGHLFEIEGDPRSSAQVTGGAWNLTRTGDGAGALTVNVTVSETGGDFVPAGNEGTQTVSFADGETTAQYRPIEDDGTQESHGTVTVSLTTGGGYVVDSTADRAAVAVRDDDERIEFTVDPLDLTVVEGEAAQFHAVMRTADPATFTEAGDVARVLRLRQDPLAGQMRPYRLGWLSSFVEAESMDDYLPVGVEFQIAASDFVSDGNGYAARKVLPPIVTLTDTDTEGPERLVVDLGYASGSDHDVAVPATRANIPDLLSGDNVLPLATSTFIAAVVTIDDPPPSDDATLGALKLTDADTGHGIELDPSFARNVLEYAAEVPTSVQNITLEATANHSGTVLKYMNGKEGALADFDPDTDGFQVGLMVGTTVTKVLVEAENGAKQIYSASVMRQGPPFSLTVDTIADDDVVNIREKADGFTVSGDAESEEMGGVAGASVTVVIGNETLTATADSAGLWSVSIPPNAPYITEPSVTVTVNATGMHSTVAPEVTRTLKVDLTSPKLDAVTVDEDTLTLTYDETLGENGVPPSAFSVSANGVVRSDLIAVAVGGTDVVLALTSAVTAGDTVTLSYTAPAPANGRPIRDAAGNEVQSLTDYPVANNTRPGERCAGADGSLRLVDGNDAKEGRVELCADDDTSDPTPARWGVVCDDYWTNDDADVVCKALDYERSEPRAGRFRESHFGAGNGPIWLDDLLCDGDETSLLDCPVAGGRRAQDAVGEHNCRVTEIVGVRCMAEDDPLKPHVVYRLEVTEPGADGGYEPGDRVRAAVTFNEAVVVDSSGGTPTIDLNLGDGRESVSRAAPYVDGSGTNRLEFEYRVVATDGEFEVLEVASDSLATNGGTIRNAQGLDAILAHGSAAEPIERFLQSPLVSVSDAAAQEGSQLLFEVSLNRSASNAVSVDYRTEDGTATADADYEAVSGTLTFAPGQTAMPVSVGTRDDAHDEGEETLTLVLSDARGARISDGNATGRIVNSDPMPRAWLARFGRTVAEHAVGAIDARLHEGEGVTSMSPDWLGNWSAWGRMADSRFNGTEGPLSLNGEVASATLGLDTRWKRWLAGVAISHSLGEGDYSHETAAGGVVRSSLTSLQPYASYQFDERLSAWGLLGYGAGELTLRSELAENAIETGLTSTMAAFGGRGVLRRSSGGFELAVVSDALLTNTVSEATAGLMGAEGDTGRLRLMLEGSGSMSFPAGGELRPTVKAGLRYDTGDAETGAGIEIGGGLAYVAGRFSARVDGRVLLVHEDTDYEEWGFSGSVRWQPDQRGRGWSMNLGSAWGVTASGVDALWSRPKAAGLARGAATDPVPRFEAELGYGLYGRRGLGLWYPFVGTRAAADGTQSVRVGVKLSSAPNLDVALEIGRRVQPGGVPDRAIQLQGAMRW